MNKKRQLIRKTEALGPLLNWQIEEAELILETNEAKIRLISLAPDLVRIQMVPWGKELPTRSYAVITESDHWPHWEGNAEDSENLLRWYPQFNSGAVVQRGLTVEVTKDPFRLVVKRPDGSIVVSSALEGGFALLYETTSDQKSGAAPGSARNIAIDGTDLVSGRESNLEKQLRSVAVGSKWALQSPDGVRYYGFGQKQGFLDKRGQKMSLWATDEPLHILDHDELYQAIPFFLTMDENGRSAGIFIDCTTKVTYDVAKTKNDECLIETDWPTLDAYVFAGPSTKDVIQKYTELTGRMELPPLWALGYQQCRYSYYPDERVREVATEMRAREIPCDAIYLDIHYMDGYRVFTWDKDRFPDPGQMVADLAEQGFKVVNIVDPGVKLDGRYKVFQEGIENEHFICYPDGELFVGTVWPGKTVFPDFLREETSRWWGELHRDFIENVGIAGIWNDMNEPSCFARNTLPDEVLQGKKGEEVAHVDVHNLYGLTMAMATHDGLKQIQPDKRPFVLTRSGYAGIQRYAAVWMGDNHSWWEHLHMAMPMCMGMGLSGVSFVGTDIGGFQRDCDGELFARWMQMGAFTPLCRTHTAVDTIDQEPWSFGSQVEDISREFLRLRYRLLPYLYNEFYKSSKTGLPIMRPLFLEYPTDQNTFHVSDQFLLGEDLLVCPVYQRGLRKRMVYIPRGEWIDFWTGQRFQGEQHIIADAPLERIPLFVRAGAIVPMEQAINFTDERDGKELFLHVYLPNINSANGENSAKLELYEDEGEGFGYKNGECALTTITLKQEVEEIVLHMGVPTGEFSPLREKVTVHLYGEHDWEELLNSGNLKVEAILSPSTTVDVNDLSNDGAQKISVALGSKGELVATVFTPNASEFSLRLKV